MNYFTKDYIEFFKELSENNNRDWFHGNKKRYERDVKLPFLNFVTSLISEINEYDSKINQNPKKCISRINRDVRFSNDKTPYNLHLNAHITKGDPNHNPFPIIAIRLGGFEAGIMSGHFRPSKERLHSIRLQIDKAPAVFKELHSAEGFVQKFGKIEGDASKRIPSEFQQTYKIEPLIANKQFYYMSALMPVIATQESLMSTIIEFYKCAKPINDFLTKEV